MRRLHRFALASALATAWALASVQLALGFPSVAFVQKGVEASNGGATITATLPGASSAGDLLVASVVDVNSGCSSDSYAAPAGWVKVAQSCRGSTGPVELWYYANAPAGISSVTFTTGSNGANSRAQLSEYSGADTASPLDQIGTANNTRPSTSLAVTTSGAIAAPGELGVTAFTTSQGLSSFTPAAGWTSLKSDPGNGFDSDYILGPARSATLGESMTSSPQTAWGAVIATFAPPCTRGSLTLAVPASLIIPTVTLTGLDITATTAPALTLSDMTGDAAGWNLTGTSTTFKTTAGKTLPTSAVSLTSVTASAATGNCGLPTNSVAYPLTLPAGTTAPTAVKLYNAAADTGFGPTNVTLNFAIAFPANTLAGSYASTWTLSAVSGP